MLQTENVLDLHEKVVNQLQRNGGKLSKRGLQQRVHVNAEELESVLSSLKSSREITVTDKEISLTDQGYLRNEPTDSATESEVSADNATLPEGLAAIATEPGIEAKDRQTLSEAIDSDASPDAAKAEAKGPKSQAGHVIATSKMSGDRPKFNLAGGPVPASSCSLVVPAEILEASNIAPHDGVELTASEGQIFIRKVGTYHKWQVPGCKPDFRSDSIVARLLQLQYEREHPEDSDLE